MTTVYATKWGRGFHESPDCRSLGLAQMLSDWDCPEGNCSHRHAQTHATEEFAPWEALSLGKWPCRTCWPEGFESGSCADDFGHRPVEEGADFPTPRVVCLWCTVWTSWPDVDLKVGRRVAWPCTSARILGLAPREEIS